MNVGDKAVPLELLDLGRLVRDICGEHETVLRQKGMDIRFRGEPGCLIMGNPLLIERILLNLWSNSAKYKEEAGGHIWMTLKKRMGRSCSPRKMTGPAFRKKRCLIFSKRFTGLTRRGRIRHRGAASDWPSRRGPWK